MKSLKQLFATICLVLFILLISSQSFLAQETKQPKEAEDENPSLQETFDWLKSKLDGYEVKFTASYYHKSPHAQKAEEVKHSFNDKYFNFRLDGCSLMWEQQRQYKVINLPMLDEEKGYKHKILFSNLDPLNIKVNEVTSYFNSEEEVDTVSPEIWYVNVVSHDSKDKYNPAANFGFFFNDREIAKRVAKAFQNAVKKCGGKVEPF